MKEVAKRAEQLVLVPPGRVHDPNRLGRAVQHVEPAARVLQRVAVEELGNTAEATPIGQMT